MPTRSSSDAAVTENDRFTAALSYVWILALYTLLFKRKSSFIQFHARQGLALFVVEVISPFFLFLTPVIWVLCIVLSIMGIRACLKGKYWQLPWLGKWLTKSGI